MSVGFLLPSNRGMLDDLMAVRRVACDVTHCILIHRREEEVVEGGISIEFEIDRDDRDSRRSTNEVLGYTSATS
jgi:hypothetical protein